MEVHRIGGQNTVTASADKARASSLQMHLEQTTDNRQQTTDNRQQTTDNRQKTTDNRQQTTIIPGFRP